MDARAMVTDADEDRVVDWLADLLRLGCYLLHLQRLYHRLRLRLGSRRPHEPSQVNFGLVHADQHAPRWCLKQG
jgi:hypothetical protein